MKNEFSFEKLIVWQESKQLVKMIYELTATYPNEERYGLTSQIRRAAISVPSNIAEGSGRLSSKEKIRFNEIAYGSLMEVYCQLSISVDLNYISKNQFESLSELFHSISIKLNALKRAFSAE